VTESKNALDDSTQPGFASQQDIPDLARSVGRHVGRALPVVRSLLQKTGDRAKRLRGAPRVIEFFHRVDDPYSDLALQCIPSLRERYDVAFRFHLVDTTDRFYAPEPEMLSDYARRDCAQVAPHYGLSFAERPIRPRAEMTTRAERLLAALLSDSRFVDVGIAAGRALWQGDDDALEALASHVLSATPEETRAAIAEGNDRRRRRRHYSGGMFWYGGEWYWGVDRLHHLERRLRDSGAARPGAPTSIRFDRPAIDPGPKTDAKGVALEFYPSLRSPYTAMIFDRSLAVAASAGVPVELRPVMPMVMRGVPAPAAKGLYIFLDAYREALHLGVPYGDMYDPIGKPVERGFSLWPFARERGRGAEYLSSFLRAAFAEGRNMGTDTGLRRVVEDAGLDWEQAKLHLDQEGWREELEANRQVMYEELGVWGVPSYRVRGPGSEPDLCVWGQDRLWLVAAELRRRLA